MPKRSQHVQQPHTSASTLWVGDHRGLLISLTIVLLTLCVFARTRGYPFVNYDDPGYVAENPEVIDGLTIHGLVWAFTHAHGGNWHPFTTLSHMLDCQLFGLWPGGPHIVNVLLHSAAAVLLFHALRQMTAAFWRSAFVATFFAIHPLRVESVVWISERKDVLSGLMFMLVLLAYRHYTRATSVRRYALVAMLFALGLMSKPMLVTMPILLLLLDYWPLQRVVDLQAARRLALEMVPLLLMSTIAATGTVIAQSRMHALESLEAMPLSWRISNAAVSCVTYIREMLWPVNLAVFYPHPENRLSLVAVLAAGALVAAITGWAVLLRKSRPYFTAGWFWYLVMLLPVIGIFQVGLQAHADRYTYLPQIGLYVAIVWAVADLSVGWRHRRGFVATAAAAAIIALAWTATAQTAYWRDSETLWRRALVVTSDNDVAHTNLAQALLHNGQPQEAITHCKAAIEMRPDNATPFTNLGIALQETGDIPGAVNAWRESLRLRPGGWTAEGKLAWVLATAPDDSLRNGAEAVALAEQANAATNYGNATLVRTLAAAYAEAGRFDRAAATAETALNLARASGDSSFAAKLQVDITNFRSNLRLRDQTLSRVRAPALAE